MKWWIALISHGHVVAMSKQVNTFAYVDVEHRSQ
ncbi:hypothetical protein J3D43_004140 [Paenibacillus xylanexedens]|nr:hypothetical protein [Paenibacillus xylanexedens]